jgi:hypothetical protein
VKAAQDEASPAELRGKTPVAQKLLLAEHEGVLRRSLLQVNVASGLRPWDGRVKALAAAGELTIFNLDLQLTRKDRRAKRIAIKDIVSSA